MRIRLIVAGVFFAASALHAAYAAAAVLTYDSETEFLNQAGFSPSAAAVVRQGDGDQGGPFEYALLQKDGIALIDSLGDVTWSEHETHDPGLTLLETGLLRLTLTDGQGLFGDTGLQEVGANPAINALIVQVVAGSDDTVSLENIAVVLDAGEQIVFGPILDQEGDGEFLMLVDSRLAKGFSLTAAATLVAGGETTENPDIPAYRFSLGSTIVPLPGAGWLFLSALVVLMRRRCS